MCLCVLLCKHTLKIYICRQCWLYHCLEWFPSIVWIYLFFSNYMLTELSPCFTTRPDYLQHTTRIKQWQMWNNDQTSEVQGVPFGYFKENWPCYYWPTTHVLCSSCIGYRSVGLSDYSYKWQLSVIYIGAGTINVSIYLSVFLIDRLL